MDFGGEVKTNSNQTFHALAAYTDLVFVRELIMALRYKSF